MARRQAHKATVGAECGDENLRPFGPATKRTDDDANLLTHAASKRPALAALQHFLQSAAPSPVAGSSKRASATKRDLARQQSTARRAARLSCGGPSLCRAPPSFEIYAELSGGKEVQVKTQAAFAAAPTVSCDENGFTCPMDNGTSSNAEREQEMECEVEGEVEDSSPMVLDTSLHVPQPMSYSEVREQESGSEYFQDIYNYLRELELKMTPKPDYMTKQPDITSSMRTILVDWLVEVAEEYRLHPETLFLCVSYVDRFLSSMSVIRNKLQLVGTSALFIAAKFEEVYPPDVSEFVFITDDTYTKRQVLRMEHMVLDVLSFRMAAPTIYYFMSRFTEVDKVPETVKHLAHYLCELTFLEDDPYLQYLPSIVAGAAVCLANHTLKRCPWSPHLVLYSGYNMEDFRECMHSLYSSFSNAGTHEQQAIQEKFKSPRYHSVAILKPSFSLPC